MRDVSEARTIYLAETADPVLDEVTACLQDDSESVRLLAAAVLGRLGPPAVPSLVQALSKTQPVPVRSLAACSLASLGPDAAPAVAIPAASNPSRFPCASRSPHEAIITPPS